MEYIPGLRDPMGQYKFTFSGSGWAQTKEIQVVDANGPRLYLTLNSDLIIYKFDPMERVRIFAYEKYNGERRDAKLIGWKEYIVDTNGELTIATDITGNYVAVGEKSGEVFSQEEGESDNWTLWLGLTSDVYCDNALKEVGIKPNGSAKVMKDILPIYKYDSAGKVIEAGNETFGKGTIVKIMSNAICYDGMFLWNVQCSDKDCGGMIPEADSNGVYLRPNNGPAYDRESNSSFSCPYAPPTRVEVGKTARITFMDGRPVRMRNSPSIYGLIIEKIPEGTKFQVISGPHCYGYVWWKIELENGVEGWVAEGDMDSYYIEPIE